MPWRTPKTWNTGDPLNKRNLDTYIRDQQLQLRADQLALAARVRALENAAGATTFSTYARHLDDPQRTDGDFQLSRSSSWRHLATGIGNFDPHVTVNADKALVHVSMLLQVLYTRPRVTNDFERRTFSGFAEWSVSKANSISDVLNDDFGRVGVYDQNTHPYSDSGRNPVEGSWDFGDFRTFSYTIVWNYPDGDSPPHTFRPAYRWSNSALKITLRLGGMSMWAYPLS